MDDCGNVIDEKNNECSVSHTIIATTVSIIYVTVVVVFFYHEFTKPYKPVW